MPAARRAPARATKGTRIVLAGARVAAASLALAACDAPPGRSSDTMLPAAAAAEAPPVVEVSAGEYFYTMADTIAAGATTFRLVGAGRELHHLQLVRLPEGRTAADLLDAPHGGPPPAWAELVGGPNAGAPGGAPSEVTLDLAPGTYVALCVIPSADGVPHVARGMSKTLVVTDGPGGAAMPTPTVRMTLVDYDYQFDTPLTAGPHVIEVTNAAAQPHEVLLVKLPLGGSPDDLLQWLAKPEGPPPATPVGGTVGLSTGARNLMHVTLEPGDYALYCFLPDAGDGRPHIARGMIRQVRVD